MEGELEALVSNFEAGTVQQLVSLSPDDLHRAGEEVIQAGVTISSLYTRWEHQQWSAIDIPLDVDLRHWQRVPDSLRTAAWRGLVTFYIAESAVRDTLSPILDASPFEDERNFLATQLADEARHAVFFKRLFTEVLQYGDGGEAALERLHPETRKKILAMAKDLVVRGAALINDQPDSTSAWVEAVVNYHLLLEGYAAKFAQAILLRALRSLAIMPGLQTALSALARDESRHIAFGVAALRRRCEADPRAASTVFDAVMAGLPTVITALVAPDEVDRIALPGGHASDGLEHRTSPAAQARPDPLPRHPAIVRSFMQRLETIGLPPAKVTEVERFDLACWTAAWESYERAYDSAQP